MNALSTYIARPLGAAVTAAMNRLSPLRNPFDERAASDFLARGADAPVDAGSLTPSIVHTFEQLATTVCRRRDGRKKPPGKVSLLICGGAPTCVSGPPGAAITEKEHVMDHTFEPAEETARPGAAKPKSVTKRAALAAALLVSSGLALVGFGLGSATANAEPVPAPQHFWHYCDFDHHWYFWDWDWDHSCHFDWDDDHHDHDHDH